MNILFAIWERKKLIYLILLIFSLLQLSKSSKCEYKYEYIKGRSELPKFDIIKEAIIDEDGTYKYIQIKCENKYIFIRGRKDCKYHKNIYSKFTKEVKLNHLDVNRCKVLGGGRIKKSKKNKKIEIYGYSNKYGRAENQHETTKHILERFYPDYDITWSNEGY